MTTLMAKRSPATMCFAREVARKAADRTLRQSRLRLCGLSASPVLDTDKCRTHLGAFLDHETSPE